MADLSRDGRDRGQLLLVAALAIAVAVVALVVLLNTSIYMENLATRDTDTDADDAIAFRNSVESNLWRVVAAENERNYTSRTDLNRNVTARTNRLVELTAGRHRRAGVVAELSGTTLDNGTRLVQNDSTRSLTSNNTAANWTLATGADGVRGYELNVTDASEPLSGNATEIFVDGDNGTWSLLVYDNSSDVSLAVRDDGTIVEHDACDSDYEDDTPVNLTAGTVNGTACPAIEFAKATAPPYDITYRFGDNTKGTYELTVNTSNVPSSNFDGPGPATSPYRVPVVYSVRTDVVYRSSTLAYRANVTVTEGSA